MNKFLKKLLFYCFIIFLIGEIVSRLFMDPVLFYRLNTYNFKHENPTFLDHFSNNNSKNADFIFIGSSRIPASINEFLFSKISGKKVICAGRGYMTFGVHYQALKNKVKNHPNFLKNSIVLVEYAAEPQWTSSFLNDQMLVYEPKVLGYDKPMPQLMLPHLSLNSLIEFLKISNNTISVKIQMLLFHSSFYRSSVYVQERYKNLSNNFLFADKNKKKESLVSSGGIKNTKFEIAKEKAIVHAKLAQDKIESNPELSFEILNNSSLFALNKFIKTNGGSLVLFKMPLHSVQKNIGSSKKASLNKIVFEDWLKSLDIPIVNNTNFKYDDKDFPDYWHLSKQRRDEFTELLYLNIINDSLAKP